MILSNECWISRSNNLVIELMIERRATGKGWKLRWSVTGQCSRGRLSNGSVFSRLLVM
jgi:hypothetical protein